MPTFAFRARDAQGQIVQGTREAADRSLALQDLREAGLFVTQLAPTNGAARASATVAPQAVAPSAANAAATAVAPPLPSSRVQEPRGVEKGIRPPQVARPGGNGVANSLPGATTDTSRAIGSATAQNRALDWRARASKKDMSLWFRQMHSMIHAGVGLVQALQTLGEHGTNASLRRASLDMSGRVLSGERWSRAMEAYPGLFSELMMGMVAAGEAGGFLDRICLKLAEYAERDYELEQTIKRETWYPKLLLFASILIPSVVPAVLASVQGTGNPLVAWFANVAPQLLVVGAIWAVWKSTTWASPLAKFLAPARRVFDGVKLLIPVVAKVTRALATAKFCRSMSALYASGMGPHTAVEISARACGNEAMAEGVRRIIPRLERGDSLSDTLTSTGYFPPVALTMLRTGETTGAVDTQLDKTADFLEADAETAIKQSVKVLGILVFLFVAAKIGMQVVQFYQGYASFANDLMPE